LAERKPVQRRPGDKRHPAGAAHHLRHLRRLHRPAASAARDDLGIFLPAFVFPIFLHRYLVALADNERLRPFLLGVAAAVVGLIAVVTVQIVKTSVVDVYTALIAIAAFAILIRFHSKLTVLYVVLGGGAIGALLQATVV
jgi:chromate transport protein ChrA